MFNKTCLTRANGSFGRFSDNAVDRVFFYQLEFAENNTATNCLSKCSEFGYGAGGMEYAEQCCKFTFCDVMSSADTI